MVYYFSVLLMFLLGVISLTSISKYTKLALGFAFFVLLLFLGGLRYEVGADWHSYNKIFNNTEPGKFFDLGIEPLFGILILIIKGIGLGYSGYVFLIFALSTSLKLSSIYKYSYNFFAALMIYFPIQFMSYDVNGIRQGLAIAIIFCSLKYLLERKLKLYLILVLIATGFHYSAIIFLPFYFISNIKLKPLLIHFIVVGSVTAGFLLQNIILTYFLSKLTGGDSVYSDKVLSYSESEAFGKGLSLGFSTIHRIAIFYLFYLFYDKIVMKENLKNLLLNSYLISLVIYFLFSSIEIVAARGSLYYRSFDILIISSFITIRKEFIYRVFILGLITFYSLWGVYTNLKLPGNGLVPYDNLIFQLTK